MKKDIRCAGFIFLLIILAGCRLQREVLIEGRTMGTTYHIKLIAGYFDRTADLKEKIDRRLKEINASMSTYDADSELSRFNSIRNTDKRFAVSKDLFYVVKAAEKLYDLTDGAWDGTVKPLVDLWGFGNPSVQKKIPSKKAIDRLLAEVGFNQIQISDNHYIRKKKPAVSLDLNSIAKGFAVDRIAALIRESGIADFLVEIGGEVYASGMKQNRQPWRVGINRPSKNAPLDQVYRIVTLQNRALATSGDYRNFFEMGGRRYSHVLNPRTGYPVCHSVVSTSVMAETCTFADGLATALMVMGPHTGLALVERLDAVEAMIVIQRTDGTLVDYYSSGFNPVKVSQ